MDNRILVFLTVLVSVIVAMVTGAAVASGDLLQPALVVVLLAGVGVVAKPEITAFTAVALYASGITLPALPGQLNLSELAMVGAFSCSLLQIIFEKRPSPQFTPAHWLLLAFCAVLLFTGWRRGFGFQFLGSSMWGGFHYVKIFLLASLVFALPRVNMSVVQWRWAVLFMGLLAPLSLFADLLVLRGMNLGMVNMFLQTGGSVAESIQEQQSGGGIGRLQSAGAVASAMLLTLLAFISVDKMFGLRGLRYQLLLVIIFILSLLSGFRLMTATLAATIVIVAILQKSLTTSRVLSAIMFFACGVGILYIIAPSLPLSVQRAASWLPGIDVSAVAASDAKGTVTWRLELWQYALRSIPDYFWVGQGFSYDANQFLSARGGYASVDPLNWALVTGAYHNGYLSLLLVTGIFGFLTGFPLLILVTLRHFRMTSRQWHDGHLQRFHQVFFASQLCLVVTYFTVYGDVTASFPPFLFNWAILEALWERDASSPSRMRPRQEPEDYASLN